jgi:hypothetical protein
VAAQRLTREGIGVGVARVGSPDWRVASRLETSRWSAVGTPIAGEVLRASIDLEAHWALGAQQLRLRSTAAALSGGALPPQDLVRFGGPVSGPGYAFHRFAARRGMSQRLELQRRIPFVPMDLGRFGRVPATLVLAPYAHAVWVDGGIDGTQGWYPSLGLGGLGFFDLLRVDVARGLRDGTWTFSVDVSPALWPVL